MIEWLIYFFVIIGVIFTFLGNLGLLRLPDLLCRTHALTKALTLGIGSMILALGCFFYGTVSLWKIALILIFQFLTIPISGHLLVFEVFKKGLKFPSIKK